MAKFFSAWDLCSLVICLCSVLPGIDDDDALEPWRDCGCVEPIACGRIDCSILLLELLLLFDGNGPFELLLEDLCGAPLGNVRSGGTLRSLRSFLCCLLEFELDPDADALPIDADAAC